MNGRKLFLEFAQQEHGKEAVEFVEIQNEFYSDTLEQRTVKGKKKEPLLITWQWFIGLFGHKNFKNEKRFRWPDG